VTGDDRGAGMGSDERNVETPQTLDRALYLRTRDWLMLILGTGLLIASAVGWALGLEPNYLIIGAGLTLLGIPLVLVKELR